MLEVVSVVPFRDDKQLVEVRYTWKAKDPNQPWWVFWTTWRVNYERRYQYLTDGIYWYSYPSGDEVWLEQYPDVSSLKEAMREYTVKALIQAELIGD